MRWGGIAASALLVGLYALGGPGWVLGFFAFVPWLRSLDGERSLRGALLSAWVLAIAYTAAGYAWFASAIGSYTQAGFATALAVMLLAAPLLQPQILAFALVRGLAGPARPVLRAVAAAAAWVATEWCVPRLMDDTFGYGLYPSQLLRQGADAVGVPGLTFLLLLANEGIAAALARRRAGVRALAVPLALATLAPLLLAVYGVVALARLPEGGERLRVAMVQSNIVDYERLRRERGAGAVVREVLDTHYAMSYDAVERQHAQAVLWSETVYPTTFGHPKSEAGAELDREILQIVDAAGVPFVFGTYDRDAGGEYNAAAFVAPGSGLLGSYRKTRPFPFTEYVPPWLEGETFRRWFPWTGRWQPGDGARVFPLRLKDGREIPVQPLVCLDDVDADLAVAGARLGAQALVTLSNDSWFTAVPQGARLHLAAAAFRSVETRLPQFRVTTNGYSAVIDASGSVVASTRMGERTLLVGELPVRESPGTLVLAWGNWVGRAAAVFLVLLGAVAAGRAWRPRPAASPQRTAAAWPQRVVVLPKAARIAAALLRTFARASLLWMAAAVAFGEGPLHTNTLAQIRTFVVFFLAPELAAWCVLQAFAARVAIAGGMLLFTRGAQTLQLALQDIAAVEAWRLPVPSAGAWLRMRSGERWRHAIALPDPQGFAQALAAAGASLQAPPPTRTAAWHASRAAVRHPRLDHPLAKFVLLPLVLAIPAFRLHQHIAYGGGLGELHTYGLQAYLLAFGLWWAAWAIGVVLCAAVLRALVEAGTFACVLLRPASAPAVRRALERTRLAALYLGLPLLLAWRLLAP